MAAGCSQYLTPMRIDIEEGKDTESERGVARISYDKFGGWGLKRKEEE